MRYLINLFLAMALLSSCGNNQQEAERLPTVDTPTKEPHARPQQKNVLSQQDSVQATARQVLLLIKQQNFDELVKYFSTDGVTFSPYGYIDVAKSKKLAPSDFLEAVHKNWILTWGSYDGTGDPIRLTVKQYLRKFAYNADYLNAEAVGYNEVVKKGNSQLNFQELYPNKPFLDYHFSGFDQKTNGMDWTSLKLIFDKQQDQYFLLAIVHDQWTI